MTIADPGRAHPPRLAGARPTAEPSGERDWVAELSGGGAERLRNRAAELLDRTQDCQQGRRCAALLLLGTVDPRRGNQTRFMPGLFSH